MDPIATAAETMTQLTTAQFCGMQMNAMRDEIPIVRHINANGSYLFDVPPRICDHVRDCNF